MPMKRPNVQQVVAATFVVTMFVVALDATAVNVGLLAIARSLHGDVASSSTVSIAYLTGAAAFMPLAGALSDRTGAKRTYLAAMTVFVIASAVCAGSTSLVELVTARAAQGAASGLLIPVVTSMLFHAFDASERVRVAQLSMIGWVCAPALGPLFGGWCVTYLSWRWIFLVNLPIGAVLLGGGAVLLAGGGGHGPVRWDVLGSVLSPVGLGAVFFALARGADAGWADPLVSAVGVPGLLVLAAFVVVQLRAGAPLLRLHLVAEPRFRNVTTVSILGIAAFTGLLFVIPLMVQTTHGGSPLTAGSCLFWEAIGVQVSTQFAARMYSRSGPHVLIAAGLLASAAVTAGLLLIGSHTNLWWLRALVLCLGLCMGWFFMPIQVAGFQQIPRAELAHATTLSTIARQLAAALGVAAMATALAAHGPAELLSVAGLHRAYLLAVAIFGVGAVAAFHAARRERAKRRPQPIASSSALTSPPVSSPQS